MLTTRCTFQTNNNIDNGNADETSEVVPPQPDPEDDSGYFVLDPIVSWQPKPRPLGMEHCNVEI